MSPAKGNWSNEVLDGRELSKGQRYAMRWWCLHYYAGVKHEQYRSGIRAGVRDVVWENIYMLQDY